MDFESQGFDQPSLVLAQVPEGTVVKLTLEVSCKNGQVVVRAIQPTPSSSGFEYATLGGFDNPWF